MRASDTLYLICGAPHHGKDTFGQFLADALGVKKGAPSDIIYEEMAELQGCTVEDLKAVPKEKLRPKLVTLGDQLTRDSPTYLVEQLRKRGVRVVTGVRRMLEAIEVEEPKKIIWVERIGYPIIEDNTEYDLREIADKVVEALEGDLEALRRAAQQMAVEG